jgi:hypothetical protein
MATEYTESLDTLLQDTIPELPGVVRAVAERELRLTFREFFERSFAWRSVLTVDAPAGDTAIWLQDSNDLDANSDVIGILHVAFEGNGLGKYAAKPDRTYSSATNLPVGYYMTSNPDEFKLYPQLETAKPGALEIHVALTPKIDATTFPRQIATKFYDALREGFLARMYAHPNKPYSAPIVAQQMRHNFRRRIGYYIAQAKQGYNDAQAWSYPVGWRK